MGYDQQVEIEVWTTSPEIVKALTEMFEWLDFHDYGEFGLAFGPEASADPRGVRYGSYQSRIYEGEGWIGGLDDPKVQYAATDHPEETPWPATFGIELIEREGDWYFDVARLSAKLPDIKIVLEYRGEEQGDEERLTFQDGAIVKRESLDWVPDTIDVEKVQAGSADLTAYGYYKAVTG